VQVLGPRPGALPPTDAELDAYFRAVIEAVPCDVHLSNNPLLTGYSLPLDLIDALLADYAQVRVVCVTERDPADLYAYVNVLAERVEVRVGMTRELRACQDLGATGLLSFEANVLPRLAAAAWEDGDAYERLLRLNAALARGGNPRSLKAVLDAGSLRDPYLPLSPAEADELREVVRALR
jgi:4-hydroxy-tetrahydrodipicolinate synthase